MIPDPTQHQFNARAAAPEVQQNVVDNQHGEQDAHAPVQINPNPQVLPGDPP